MIVRILRAAASGALVVMLGGAALAQDAAAVYEARHDLMEENGKALRAIRDMIRGDAPYDAATVRAHAETIAANAGSTMTALFPEGSLTPDSEALPAIWEDWPAFAALAERLGVTASGLALAADNTGEAGAEQATASAAALMGAAPAPEAQTPQTAEDIGRLPAQEAFAMVADVCGACHADFRAE